MISTTDKQTRKDAAMIYTPEQTATILEAMNDAMLGNNGYATVPAVAHNDWLRQALNQAGFAVIGNKVYTAQAQESLKGEAFAVKREPLKASSLVDTRHAHAGFKGDDGFNAKIDAHESENLF